MTNLSGDREPYAVDRPAEILRVGLRWIVAQADADFQACEPDDLTDAQRASIISALNWLDGLTRK